MGLLDKLWDDVVAGPQPGGEHGFRSRSFPDAAQAPSSPPPPAHEFGRRLLERRRSADFQRQQEEARRVTNSIAIPSKQPQRPHVTIPEGGDQEQLAASPSSPAPSPSPGSAGPRSSVERENVWRSVFHPGSNRVMKKLGSQKFDKAEPNSPTVYDWLYSGETKSSWR